MKGTLSNVSPCHRPLVRALMLRRRPVALLLAGLAVWLVVYLFSIHRSSASSSSSLPDPQGIAVYRMAEEQQAADVQKSLSENDLLAEAARNNSFEEDREASEARKDDAAFEEEEREFSRRREHYESLCQSGLSGPVGDVQYYEPAQLALCLVPKVGSTFWMQILHYLYKDTDGMPVNSPLDIDRYHVHFASGQKTKITSYYRSKAMIDEFNKVIFVRDPWSRMWSSYVDKLVLPDSWLDHGVSILARRPEGKGRGRTTRHCADDVSFGEFLDYAVKSHRDAHWRPVSKVCNPCVFRPRYVGKLETFAEDTKHILRAVGLQNLTEGRDSLANYTEDQVRQITDYHFRLYEVRTPLQRCLSHSGLAERLWKAFVLNGYIAEDIEFPRSEFVLALNKPMDVREAGMEAAELLLKYHKSSPSMTARQLQEYRRSVMAHHYRKVPTQLLEMLVDIFNADFTLFDYDPRPSDIFVPFAESIVHDKNS